MHEPFNVSEWLVDRHVEAGRGDRTAVIVGGERYTYDDVLALVERAAAGLRSLGVRPEERVAMVMLDSVEFVAVFLGAVRIGAVPLPVNPLLPGRDLGVIVADARARTLVITDSRTAALADLRALAVEVEHVVTTAPDDDAGLIGWERFLGDDAADGAAWSTWAESPGFWLCTSGSTGRPKLAMHRHGDIPATCDAYADGVLGIRADDVCFSVGPMFHAYGLGNSLTFPFSVGATAVLEPTRPPTPRRVADVVAAHRPTLFFCIPTFYAALLAADLPADAFASVRYAVSAAESLPAETFERFRERFGVTILDGIGSTEQLHIYLSNSPTRSRPGTSGVPVPGYEVRIVDESGADQPADAPGQLLVAGPSTATGYWCRRDTTAATFVGRWMHTGDLYVRDAAGFHTYLGRVDDMLRVGGEWVSPAEVEAILIEHPAVLEAAVVGEVDEAGVTRPIAYVVAAGDVRPDVAELRSFCTTRMAGYKRPKRFEVVDDLPKTATGKIQRFKLRADRGDVTPGV